MDSWGLFLASLGNRAQPSAWNYWQLLLIISFLSLPGGCFYNVHEDTPPLPRVQSIAVISNGPTEELQARFGVTPDNSSAGVAVGTGMGAGAAAGAGVAFACGPFVLLCALLTVPTGALVGAAGGGAVGAAVDASKKPPEEQLIELDGVFVEISQERTIHLEVRDALKHQIPPEKLASISESDALLELSLSDAYFKQDSADYYSLTLRSVVKIEWNRGKRQVRRGKRLYHYTTRKLLLEEWLENDGKLLNDAFDECVEGIVEQIAEDIRFTET